MDRFRQWGMEQLDHQRARLQGKCQTADLGAVRYEAGFLEGMKAILQELGATDE